MLEKEKKKIPCDIHLSTLLTASQLWFGLVRTVIYGSSYRGYKLFSDQKKIWLRLLLIA